MILILLPIMFKKNWTPLGSDPGSAADHTTLTLKLSTCFYHIFIQQGLEGKTNGKYLTSFACEPVRGRFKYILPLFLAIFSIVSSVLLIRCFCLISKTSLSKLRNKTIISWFLKFNFFC